MGRVTKLLVERARRKQLIHTTRKSQRMLVVRKQLGWAGRTKAKATATRRSDEKVGSSDGVDEERIAVHRRNRCVIQNAWDQFLFLSAWAGQQRHLP